MTKDEIVIIALLEYQDRCKAICRRPVGGADDSRNQVAFDAFFKQVGIIDTMIEEIRVSPKFLDS